MATPITSLKWRLQLQKNSLTNQEFYFIEYDAYFVTKSHMDELKKQLQTLGYKNVSFGLVAVIP